MSDILIKNMEMPKSCFDCPCIDEYWCRPLRTDVHEVKEDRHPDCPLIEVPEQKHGKWERKLVPVCDDGIIMIPGNVCSECGGITTYNVSLFKYCPRCGADMRGDSDV